MVLYDIQKDPDEVDNLIRNPEMQPLAKELNEKLWKWLDKTGGLYIPLKAIDKKEKRPFIPNHLVSQIYGTFRFKKEKTVKRTYKNRRCP